jgi:hypothetical protein
MSGTNIAQSADFLQHHVFVIFGCFGDAATVSPAGTLNLLPLDLHNCTCFFPSLFAPLVKLHT